MCFSGPSRPRELKDKQSRGEGRGDTRKHPGFSHVEGIQSREGKKSFRIKVVFITDLAFTRPILMGARSKTAVARGGCVFYSRQTKLQKCLVILHLTFFHDTQKQHATQTAAIIFSQTTHPPPAAQCIKSLCRHQESEKA